MILDFKKPAVKLIFIACLLAVVVVGLGAFTRLADAGLGCPDWPGCYGKLLWPDTEQEIVVANAKFADAAPVDTDKTWPEMVHRYFAGTLGLVVLAILLVIRKKQLPVKKLPVTLLVLVIVQAAFGMWTVTLKLWPQVVTAHLLGGFATLSLLWLLALRLGHSSAFAAQNTVWKNLACLRKLAAVSLAVVIVQIALGGWTTSNYAALACIDFPTCHGEWVPKTNFKQGFDFTQQVGPNYLGGLLDNDARTAIHFSHRLGALLTTLILLLLIAPLVRAGAMARKLGSVLAGLLVFQVGLGISNVVFTLPLAVAVMHNGVGALLLLAMITVNYFLYKQTQNAVVV